MTVLSRRETLGGGNSEFTKTICILNLKNIVGAEVVRRVRGRRRGDTSTVRMPLRAVTAYRDTGVGTDVTEY